MDELERYFTGDVHAIMDALLRGERDDPISLRLMNGLRLARKDDLTIFTYPETYRYATRPAAMKARIRTTPELLGAIIADCTAGIGLAAIELASVAKHVIAIEIDPVRHTLMRANLKRGGCGNVETHLGDAMQAGSLLTDADILFIDPERAANIRARTIEENTPPLQHFLTAYPDKKIIYEVSPRIPHDALPACGREYYSHKRRHARTTLYFRFPFTTVRCVDDTDTLQGDTCVLDHMPKETQMTGYLYDIDETLFRAGIDGALREYGITQTRMLANRHIAVLPTRETIPFTTCERIIGSCTSIQDARRIVHAQEDFKRVILKYPVPDDQYGTIVNAIRPSGNANTSVSIYRDEDRYIITRADA